MVCYLPGAGFVSVVFGVVVLWAWNTIIVVLRILWQILGMAAYAVEITAVAVVVTMAVYAVAAITHSIQRYRARRGSCLTCVHNCQLAQVVDLASPVVHERKSYDRAG